MNIKSPIGGNLGGIFPRSLPALPLTKNELKYTTKASKKSNTSSISSYNLTNQRSPDDSRVQPLQLDSLSDRLTLEVRGGVAPQDHHGSRVNLLKQIHSESEINMEEHQYASPFSNNPSSPPPPPYVVNKGGVPNLNRIPNIDDEGKKISMYPKEHHPKLFSKNIKAKKGWKAMKKTSKQVLPMVRRTSSGCCTTYISTVKFIRNKQSLMFLIHLSLFMLIAGYITIGAVMFMKIDNGSKYVSRGDREIERLNTIRQTAASKLLNASLKSVLEKSRDAVLDTIFTSDALQAALTVFKASRKAFLPADHQLELLSERVLTNWEEQLEMLLVKYHFISSLESNGFQLSSKQLNDIWDSPSDSNFESLSLPWTFCEASVQCFCLMSTMGSNSRAPSEGGKTATIIYVLLGAPLYWWVVLVWSKRLLEMLIKITKTSNDSKIRKISMTDDSTVAGSSWNDRPSRSAIETPPFLVFLASIITIAYVIGIGPLGCGTFSNTFGERLEAAFLSLWVVRPPNPLPSGIQSSIGFMLYVVIGHIVIFTLLRSIQKSISSYMNKIFKTERR